MKELSIEEKAKRYDEAIQRAMSIYNSALEAVIEEKVDNQNCVYSTNKVKPKFEQGKWIVWKDKHYKVNYNGCGYELLDQNGLSTSWDYKTIEDNAHLWTIQDAKDGDVLVLNDEVFIYAHRKPLYPIAVAHCSIDSAGGFYLDVEFGYTEKGNSIHPVTKEWCDLLFQKMKEAGYEWDAEKKELKKIHNVLEECKIENIEHGKYYYCIKDYFAGGKKQASKGDVVQALRGLPIMALGVNANEYFLPVNSIKQNPAWSEECELTRNALINLVEMYYGCCFNKGEKNRLLDWLKSLKERIEPQWKPSDEQMKALDWALSLAKNCGEECSFDLRTLYEQLKKLRKE